MLIIYFISITCSSRKLPSPVRLANILKWIHRYGPHKIAKVLGHAFSPDARLNGDLQSELSSPTSPLFDRSSNTNGSPSTDSKDFAALGSLLPPPTQSEPQSPATVRFPNPATPIANIPPESPATNGTKDPPCNDENQPVRVTTDPPVAASDPTIQVTLGAAPPKPEGLRVLLVEDNEINLKLLIATMRKLKLDHATATNGLEAFNAYKECGGNFDVVFMGMSSLLTCYSIRSSFSAYFESSRIDQLKTDTIQTDISMPIMSGIESTQHIRRYEKEYNIPPVALIALTGAANPNTRQEAFSSGVDLFLTKPVPMKALRSMLDDLKREGRGVFAG